MNRSSDYFIVISGYQNELLSTGFMRKATILVTPKSIYTIPFDASFSTLGGSLIDDSTGALNTFSVKTEGFNVMGFVKQIPRILEEKTIDEAEAFIMEQIPKDWQYKINQLELLNLSVRFGLLGIMKLKRKIGKKKIFYTKADNIRIISQRITNLSSI